MKQDTTTAYDQDKTRASWHPAFLEAIKLELDQYGDALEYVPEYQLTKEPLRIDVVIVKKRKDLRIEKNIAALFRGDNIIEYKSPSDYISVEDFYKVYAYACLYVTMKPRAAANITDLTVTFVGSRHPRKLAEHLEQVHGYVVEKNSPGVYSVKGDPIPMQIIDTRELPVEENLWLAQLDNRLDRAGARRIIRELDRENRAERMAAYIDAVYTANFEIMEEVSRMSDTTMVYGKTLENAGYVTRKMILAKMEEKEEIARKMKADKVSTSRISAYTGLTEQQIVDL
jgi:ribosomal protein S17E